MELCFAQHQLSCQHSLSEHTCALYIHMYRTQGAICLTNTAHFLSAMKYALLRLLRFSSCVYQIVNVIVAIVFFCEFVLYCF